MDQNHAHRSLGLLPMRLDVQTFGSDPLRGSNLEEMKQNYLSQREREFASHICAAHPRAKSTRGEPGFPR
jgi:hypothetical protein